VGSWTFAGRRPSIDKKLPIGTMAVTESTVSFSEESLAEIQDHLRRLGIDGWLLFDFRGANPIARGVLGLPELSRRWFVFIPAEGRPTAVTHRIEQQPWGGWIGEKRVYLSWQSLEGELRQLLQGRGGVAVEHSVENAVPYLDRMPAGLLELVRAAGARTVSSADLVSLCYSRWSADGERSHRRAARILRDAVHQAFDTIGARLRAGEAPTEWQIRGWLTDRLAEAGLSVGADAIVAVDGNAANPHYAPSAEQHAAIVPGTLVLIDLWGKETDDAIFADQTWMAFVGDQVPERLSSLWEGVREARDAAVSLIRARFAAAAPIAGYEVDDVARGILTERGLGAAFLHRTGHSIDRELHGSGPNIDNLETRDTRRLIPGIGFSIEPGVYLPGDVGIRSEIDVYISERGPEVTTPEPQTAIHRIGIG
jgi:Xaa-Pro dipeptidase